MYRAWCARCGGVALVVVTVQLYSTILGMDGVPLGDVEVGELINHTDTHSHERHIPEQVNINTMAGGTARGRFRQLGLESRTPRLCMADHAKQDSRLKTQDLRGVS
jgi:hypothetical protein